MKTTALLGIAITIFFSTAILTPVNAETPESETKTVPAGEAKTPKSAMPGQPMIIGNPMMMGNPMMGGKHMETEGSKTADMIMRYVMGKEIIATSDGGIVVAIGNKLYKYDSSMNLEKQVEIPIDMEGLNKMTINIKNFGMMEEKKKKEEDSTSKSAEELKPKN